MESSDPSVEEIIEALEQHPRVLFDLASGLLQACREGELRVAGAWEGVGGPDYGLWVRRDARGGAVGEVSAWKRPNGVEGLQATVSPAPARSERTVATMQWDEQDWERARSWVDGVLMDLGWELL